MGDFAGRLAAGQGDQTLNIIGWDRRLARLAGRITKKAIDTRVGKPPLPAPDHRSTDTRKPRDLRDVQPIGRMQNDPSPGHMLLSLVMIGDDRFQTNTILGRDDGTDFLGHADVVAHPDNNVNPMNVSMH